MNTEVAQSLVMEPGLDAQVRAAIGPTPHAALLQRTMKRIIAENQGVRTTISNAPSTPLKIERDDDEDNDGDEDLSNLSHEELVRRLKKAKGATLKPSHHHTSSTASTASTKRKLSHTTPTDHLGEDRSSDAGSAVGFGEITSAPVDDAGSPCFKKSRKARLKSKSSKSRRNQDRNHSTASYPSDHDAIIKEYMNKEALKPMSYEVVANAFLQRGLELNLDKARACEAKLFTGTVQRLVETPMWKDVLTVLDVTKLTKPVLNMVGGDLIGTDGQRWDSDRLGHIHQGIDSNGERGVKMEKAEGRGQQGDEDVNMTVSSFHLTYIFYR
jgi:hypothetical protein